MKTTIVELMTQLPTGGDKNAPALSEQNPLLPSGSRILVQAEETAMLIIKKPTDLIDFTCFTTVYIYVTEWRHLYEVRVMEDDVVVVVKKKPFSDKEWAGIFRRVREGLIKGDVDLGTPIPSLDVEEKICIANTGSENLKVSLTDKSGCIVWESENPLEPGRSRTFYLGANVRALTIRTESGASGRMPDYCVVSQSWPHN